MDNKTPNRFAGGCKVNPKADTQRKGVEDLMYVKDIRWYPQKQTMVIEKSNHTSLTVDLSVLVGETTKTTFPIKVAVWNPDKEPEPGYDLHVVVQKDVEFTEAIQKIVDTISSDNSAVFRTNVTKVVKDVVPDMNILTKHDVVANVFDPVSGETHEDIVVPKHTEMTDAIQLVVNMDPTIQSDITAHRYDPSTGEIKETVIVNNHMQITQALQTIMDKSRLWDVWNDDEPQGQNG